jgi:hypothetical protein
LVFFFLPKPIYRVHCIGTCCHLLSVLLAPWPQHSPWQSQDLFLTSMNSGPHCYVSMLSGQDISGQIFFLVPIATWLRPQLNPAVTATFLSLLSAQKFPGSSSCPHPTPPSLLKVGPPECDSLAFGWLGSSSPPDPEFVPAGSLWGTFEV